VLTEERMGPVYAAVPAPTDAEWREAARRACSEAARAGFVGVHSLMAHEREVRALLDLHREGPLPVRVILQLPYSMLEAAAALGLRTGFGDDRLAIGAIKLFSDGSLGARTAALRQPYADDSSTRGELIYEPHELAQRVASVYAAGFQVCLHAIGDRAMDVTLDALEHAAGASEASGHPVRFPPRIEHASMVDEGLLHRMRALGVGAAIQPQFARSDSWTPDRLGEARARGCYAFRSMWEAGIPLAGSTDCPVESLDAMAALGQLVHRPAWSPEEKLPLEAALRVFSEGSYALRGLPEGSGRLAVGQYADFVVLEEDPFRVPAAEVERIPVAMTVVGGAVVYPA
jgi:predicted amidohydrolase YtcJ